MADTVNTTIGRFSLKKNAVGNGFFVIWTSDDGFYAIPNDRWINPNPKAQRIGNPLIMRSIYSDVISFKEMGPHAWPCDALSFDDSIFLSNRPLAAHEADLDDSAVPNDMVFGMFSSFAIDTRLPMWHYMGNSCLGTRLLIPYQAPQLRAFQELFERMTNNLDDFALEDLYAYNVYMDACVTTPTGAPTAGFDPKQWPGCYKLSNISCMSTAMTIAGVQLTKEPLLEYSFPNQHFVNFHDHRLKTIGIGPRCVPFGTSVKAFSWRDLDSDVADSILEFLVAHAVSAKKYDFCAVLSIRGVCKHWQTVVDHRFEDEYMTIYAAMLYARRTKLISDWIAVRKPCFRNGIRPWNFSAESCSTAHPEETVLRKYMKLKTIRIGR